LSPGPLLSMDEFNRGAKERLAVLGSLFLDSVFLLLWVLLQYGTTLLIEYFKFTGVDALIFGIFQWAFAGSTLVVVLAYLIKDASILIIRTYRQIRAIWTETTPRSLEDVGEKDD